ncbi:MAG: hypothetical protein AAB255_00020 [Bacteroidota bacterium]
MRKFLKILFRDISTRVGLFLILSQFVNAQHLNFRNSASGYFWETRDTLLNPVSNFRGNNNLYFNYVSNYFTLRGNVNFFNDVNPAENNKLKTKIPSLFISTEQFDNKLKLILGRQFISSGVGVGTIDGGNLSIRFFDNLIHLSGFGGYYVVRNDEFNFNKKLINNNLFGGAVSIYPDEEIFLRLSYVNKSWERNSFTTARLDSLFEPKTIIANSLPQEEEYFSFDASYENNSDYRIFFRSDYNVYSRTISRANIFAKYKISSPLEFSLEYFYREPRVSYNSIFSVFHSSSTNEVEASAEYILNSNARFFTRLANVKYVDESSSRFSFGGVFWGVNFNYSKNFGYSGDLNGISILTSYPLLDRKLNLNLGVGFASYQLSETSPKNNITNFTLGATYYPIKYFTLDVYSQIMKNPQYKSDVRLMLKASYFYSHLFKGE